MDVGDFGGFEASAKRVIIDGEGLFGVPAPRSKEAFSDRSQERWDLS